MTVSPVEPLKITVPADFGVKNLDAPFHSNISLILQEGASYRANSVILSYNSPVFERLFLELNQSVLDVDDFSPDTVKCFVRSLYSGRVKLDTTKFREMNKLGKVFSVSWVQYRCREFWVALLDKASSMSSFPTLKFLAEEAHYVKSALKEPSYIDLFIKKVCGLKNRVELFIQPYLIDYYTVENWKLDIAIEVAGRNPSCILNILKRNIVTQGCSLDKTSQYLLNNLDMCLCIKDDEQVFEEVFDTLSTEIKDVSTEDLIAINKLYRSTRKENKTESVPKASGSQIVQNSSITKTQSEENPGPQKRQKASTGNTMLYSISMLMEEFEDMDVNEFLQYIEWSGSIYVRNLYDCVDALILVCKLRRKTNIKDVHVQKIARIRVAKGWKRVNPNFLLNWISHSEISNKLSTLYDLVSYSESTAVFGHYVCNDTREYKLSMTPEELFSANTTFFISWHDEHDQTTSSIVCNVYPMNPSIRGQNVQFKIEIDSEKSTSSVPHEKIHLAVCSCLPDTRQIVRRYTSFLSWRYEPLNTSGHLYNDIADESLISLMAYITY